LISANHTSAAAKRTQLAEDAKVIGVVITRSPFLRFKASTERCKPAVALVTATAYFEPIYSENLVSNSLTLGP
jgi:hypothetical protein